jgi:hypothetical protein
MKKTLHGMRHIRARYTVAIGREKKRKRKTKRFKKDFLSFTKTLSVVAKTIARLFYDADTAINKLYEYHKFILENNLVKDKEL